MAFRMHAPTSNRVRLGIAIAGGNAEI